MHWSSIWQRPTLYLWEHDFKSFNAGSDLMHSSTKKKPTIIIFFTSWCVIIKYCSILVNNIKKMHSVAVYHPFQVFISISLVQILKNTSKPCLSTSQKLKHKLIWSIRGTSNVYQRNLNVFTASLMEVQIRLVTFLPLQKYNCA